MNPSESVSKSAQQHTKHADLLGAEFAIAPTIPVELLPGKAL
jgi:hypothetical protein